MDQTINLNFKSIFKYSIYTIISIIILTTIISMFNNIKLGSTAVYENSLTGTKEVVHGPSFVLKAPVFGNLEIYKKDTTVSFAPHEEGENFTSISNPIRVAFADTYKAKLLLNARLVLPVGDDQMLSLHEAFRTYDNLVRSLYTKTMVDVAVNTSQQFTAEEVFQGGLNGLKSAIEDQAAKGVYVTKRMKVKSEMGVTDRVDAGDKKTGSKAISKAVYVWKAVPLKDYDNKIRRTKNPLEQYGVVVTQVNLAEPLPEPLLEKLLSEKKQLVAKKIASIQKQENAKTNIETAKLEGEAARVEAEQKRLIIADAEIIELKKQVKVAEQQALKEIVEQEKLADLAVIDKNKELQIAEANEGIQIANEKAAKYEAQAKLHNGLADAQILKATYDAYDKTLYAMEIQRDTMTKVTRNLQGISITMPQTMISSGEDSTATNSLDTVMNAIGIQKLQEIATQTK